MVAKRLLGNRPPARATLASYGHRLLFDNDADNDADNVGRASQGSGGEKTA
jgi:hypothetical protein